MTCTQCALHRHLASHQSLKSPSMGAHQEEPLIDLTAEDADPDEFSDPFSDPDEFKYKDKRPRDDEDDDGDEDDDEDEDEDAAAVAYAGGVHEEGVIRPMRHAAAAGLSQADRGSLSNSF